MLNSDERRNALKKTVCSTYGVSEDELFSLNRRREIVSARRMILYFFKKALWRNIQRNIKDV